MSAGFSSVRDESRSWAFEERENVVERSARGDEGGHMESYRLASPIYVLLPFSVSSAFPCDAVLVSRCRKRRQETVLVCLRVNLSVRRLTRKKAKRSSGCCTDMKGVQEESKERWMRTLVVSANLVINTESDEARKYGPFSGLGACHRSLIETARTVQPSHKKGHTGVHVPHGLAPEGAAPPHIICT